MDTIKPHTRHIMLLLIPFLLSGCMKDTTQQSPFGEDGTVEIRLIGQQFHWTIWYPGDDGEFGKTNSELRSVTNPFGIDSLDRASRDDILDPDEMHLPVNREVHLEVQALDVLHSAYFPHFRVKMDAIPGMPTQLFFTPKITTKDYRNLPETKAKADSLPSTSEEFNYVLVCNKVCGKGHYDMKKTVVVETDEEYLEWLKRQPKVGGNRKHR